MTEERENILRAWYLDPYVCHTALAKERALEALAAVAHFRRESAQRLELCTDALRREREVLNALREAHELTLETQTIGEAVADLVRLVRKARAERDAALALASGGGRNEANQLAAATQGPPGFPSAITFVPYESALREGAMLERSKIVAWLRGEAADADARYELKTAAQDIERGEHLAACGA